MENHLIASPDPQGHSSSPGCKSWLCRERGWTSGPAGGGRQMKSSSCRGVKIRHPSGRHSPTPPAPTHLVSQESTRLGHHQVVLLLRGSFSTWTCACRTELSTPRHAARLPCPRLACPAFYFSMDKLNRDVLGF